MSQNFTKLLKMVKEVRLRESSSGERGILIASESDKARVINSPSFRRLQQKAQVFPLEPNAAVRTRLTHSIEVSQIGRYICQKIIYNNKVASSENYETLASFVNNIETACLLHDIGNPPFGHFGESAIREWFRERKSAPTDLKNFDGNPQGFRLASYLSGEDVYGFNLTCTLLLSIVKYPFTSKDKSDNQNIKKIGLFACESESYNKACSILDWKPKKKFPLMHLMDASDDIAYSMSDLEDGLEKNIITIADLKNAIGHKYFESKNIGEFIGFKTYVINNAVEIVASNFFKYFDEIFEGEIVKLLPETDEIGSLIKEVNNYANKHIYTDVSAEQVELAGRSVISGLLKHFGVLLELPEDQFKELANENISFIKRHDLDYHIRLLRRIPKMYIEKYKARSEADESSRRAHLLVDYISGMTDDFALETYQILEGIRIR